MQSDFLSPVSGYRGDTGLSSYMARIYAYMTGGLALTGITAWLTAHSYTLMHMLYTMQGDVITGMSMIGWLVMLAPLGLVFMMSFGMGSLSAPAMHGAFWLYAALAGLSLSVIFLGYTDASIAEACFVTAGMFGGMSFYGHATKRDLSGMGSFMLAGLVGLIIASLVNLFLRSAGMQFGLSILGVLIFAGLTAYDTQKLKDLYLEGDNENAAIAGALTLYLDVINIFIDLLMMAGKKRS